MLLLLLLQSHSSFLAFCTKWYSNGNSIVLSEFKYSFCFIIWPPAAPESCSFSSTNLFNHCTSRSLADDDPPSTRLQWPLKAWPGALVGFNWKMISLMRQRGFQFYGHATVKRFMKKYPFLFFPPACNCWRFASFALVKARFFFRQRYSDTPLWTSTEEGGDGGGDCDLMTAMAGAGQPSSSGTSVPNLPILSGARAWWSDWTELMSGVGDDGGGWGGWGCCYSKTKFAYVTRHWSDFSPVIVCYCSTDVSTLLLLLLLLVGQAKRRWFCLYANGRRRHVTIWMDPISTRILLFLHFPSDSEISFVSYRDSWMNYPSDAREAEDDWCGCWSEAKGICLDVFWWQQHRATVSCLSNSREVWINMQIEIRE